MIMDGNVRLKFTLTHRAELCGSHYMIALCEITSVQVVELFTHTTGIIYVFFCFVCFFLTDSVNVAIVNYVNMLAVNASFTHVAESVPLKTTNAFFQQFFALFSLTFDSL